MIKRILNIEVIAAVIIAATLSCSKGAKDAAGNASTEVIPEDIVEMRFDQIKLAKIDTGSVETRYLYNTLKVYGKVMVPPQNLVTVTTPLGGYIKSSNMLPGNHVTRGQVLAIIENPEFVDIQENYLESKTRLEYAESEYKRHTELYKEDVYSQMNVQQVTADYKSLKSKVSALEQKLQMIGINPSSVSESNITGAVTIYSPISGFIKSANVNTGKSVLPTDVLFEIVNTDNLLLELTLFDKDANKIEAGQKVRFFINNETEQHEAEVYQAGGSIDQDKMYKVYAKVMGTCKNVLPGMYVNSVIEINGKKVTSLPSEAVVSFDDKDYIFVFVKNKEEKGNPFTEYRIVEVGKGMSEEGYTEVILPAGFDVSGSKVVVKGAYNLLSAKKNAGEMAC